MENFVCKRCGHSNVFPDRGLSRHDLTHADQCDRCFADAKTGRRDIFSWLNMGMFFGLRLMVASMIVVMTGVFLLLAFEPDLSAIPAWVRVPAIAIPSVALAIALWRRRVAK